MYPTLEEVRAIGTSGSYGRIPVCEELYADAYTPVGLLKTLKAASHHCYLLESAEDNHRWGRYSFLGYLSLIHIYRLWEILNLGMDAIRDQMGREVENERNR